MAAYYLTHDHNTNNTTQPPPQIQQNANLHTLLLMNNPNLASHYDQHQHQHPQSSDNNNDDSSNNNIMFNHQFVRPEYGNVTLYGYPQEEAREVSRARQGLSLTLASNNPGVGGGDGAGGGGQVSVLGSKYLRVTQELLEEVVNVGDTLTSSNNNNNIGVTSDDHSPKKGKSVCDTPSGGGGSGGGGGVQLSTSERQEILMKKAKLVTMLDEAEQRYRQYSNQMQMVIESFERAAGIGSAKTYTALALKTISKQFRCLKDAIQGQIRAANKSLGEDDGGSGSSAGKIQGSRLKFIDHQIRQQRALQQLGMIQNHNAWRPQRGLPERSVSVLRAWLFEHFLHPYPKDSDKILLAKQTGLTRSQVSNWFINARVRLWKPMIEEMYNEELKEHEQNGSEDKSNSNDQDIIDRPSNTVEKTIINNGDQTQVVKANNNNGGNYPPYEHGFTLTGALDMEGISQGSPKRQRSNQLLNNGNEILIKFGDEKQEMRDNGVGYPMISGGMNFMGGELGSYPMNDLGRFETEDFPPPRYLHQGMNGNGGISLSLGLPPSCENHHQQQQFNHLSTTSHHSFMAPNQSIISTWE